MDAQEGAKRLLDECLRDVALARELGVEVERLGPSVRGFLEAKLREAKGELEQERRALEAEQKAAAEEREGMRRAQAEAVRKALRSELENAGAHEHQARLGLVGMVADLRGKLLRAEELLLSERKAREDAERSLREAAEEAARLRAEIDALKGQVRDFSGREARLTRDLTREKERADAAREALKASEAREARAFERMAALEEEQVRLFRDADFSLAGTALAKSRMEGELMAACAREEELRRRCQESETRAKKELEGASLRMDELRRQRLEAEARLKEELGEKSMRMDELRRRCLETEARAEKEREDTSLRMDELRRQCLEAETRLKEELEDKSLRADELQRQCIEAETRLKKEVGEKLLRMDALQQWCLEAEARLKKEVDEKLLRMDELDKLAGELEAARRELAETRERSRSESEALGARLSAEQRRAEELEKTLAGLKASPTAAEPAAAPAPMPEAPAEPGVRKAVAHLRRLLDACQARVRSLPPARGRGKKGPSPTGAALSHLLEMQDALETLELYLGDPPMDAARADLAAAVADSLAGWEKAFRLRRIAVSGPGRAGDVPAVLDSRVHAVFYQILRNAYEAMPKGGRLAVAVGVDPVSGCAEVRFEDTGPGFAPEALAAAFSPFFSLKPGRLGLGLALARRVVSQLGGEMLVCNGGKGGAAVTLRLPRVTGDSPPRIC